jgi:hypothetical protein
MKSLSKKCLLQDIPTIPAHYQSPVRLEHIVSKPINNFSSVNIINMVKVLNSGVTLNIFNADIG